MTSGTAGDDTEDGNEAGDGEDHEDRCHCHGRQRRTVYSILCRHSRRPCMRPSTSSSLRITDRYFQNAPLRLWNQPRLLSVNHALKKVKVKFSHTRYRALGPELIPVYRQSARR